MGARIVFLLLGWLSNKILKKSKKIIFGSQQEEGVMNKVLYSDMGNLALNLCLAIMYIGCLPAKLTLG